VDLGPLVGPKAEGERTSPRGGAGRSQEGTGTRRRGLTHIRISFVGEPHLVRRPRGLRGRASSLQRGEEVCSRVHLRVSGGGGGERSLGSCRRQARRGGRAPRPSGRGARPSLSPRKPLGYRGPGCKSAVGSSGSVAYRHPWCWKHVWVEGLPRTSRLRVVGGVEGQRARSSSSRRATGGEAVPGAGFRVEDRSPRGTEDEGRKLGVAGSGRGEGPEA
jgi:hypothetical protein